MTGLFRKIRFDVLIFLAILLLVLVRMRGVLPMVQTALDTHGQYEDQKAFLEHEDVIGGDAVLIDWLQEEYPEGTSVSFPDEERAPLRMQRLWYALLPGFPLDPASPLVLVHQSRLEPGEPVLARGEVFALVERETAKRAP